LGLWKNEHLIGVEPGRLAEMPNLRKISDRSPKNLRQISEKSPTDLRQISEKSPRTAEAQASDPRAFGRRSFYWLSRLVSWTAAAMLPNLRHNVA